MKRKHRVLAGVVAILLSPPTWGQMMMGPGMMRSYGSPGYATGPQFESRAGQEFARACSQCHALPDPRRHTAQQWPAVVGRMELYMRRQGFPAPDGEEIQDIDGYLERHAGRG